MSRVSVEMGSARARMAFASLACAVAMLALAPQYAHAHDADEAALGSLVDAELAFARMGISRGVREAFLANFADDGIVFEPAPVKLREAWSTRPKPADPLAVKLEWAPAQAGISRSHDMGYTTGPSTLTLPGKPPRHGVFFSVWQRKGTGPWRVVLDAGTTTPGAVDFAALGAAPRPQFKGRGRISMERRKLLDREANRALGSRGFTPNGYARLVSDGARLHRDDALPVASRSGVAKAAAASFARVSWKPIDARVSAAADMAYTYGSYRETDRGGQVRDGYYAHLWLRDAQGAWQLAYDIVLPAPPR
jgi:ketosteroid isomerase-like protein